MLDYLSCGVCISLCQAHTCTRIARISFLKLRVSGSTIVNDMLPLCDAQTVLRVRVNTVWKMSTYKTKDKMVQWHWDAYRGNGMRGCEADGTGWRSNPVAIFWYKRCWKLGLCYQRTGWLLTESARLNWALSKASTVVGCSNFGFLASNEAWFMKGRRCFSVICCVARRELMMTRLPSYKLP
jgi:hypothetical protein